MTDRFLARAEFKFQPAGADAAMGAFEGYGAAFGNIDSYGDVIERGAFAQTLADWAGEGKHPPMLLQHGGGFLGGAEDLVPVGVWDQMREDDRGLYVKGRLIALDTDRGRSVYAAMREGALDGLSIGYIPREFRPGKSPNGPERILSRVDLMEVSIVTFPANGNARVEAVKQQDGEYTVRAYERSLRDAGFTREQAKVIAKGFRLTRREAMSSEEPLSDIAGAIEALAGKLTGDGHGTERSQGRS